MAEMKRVETSESCPICGNTFVVYTTMDQLGNYDQGWEWSAHDGDKAECLECGALGGVSVSDAHAWVDMDEDAPHNVKCYERHEAKA